MSMADPKTDGFDWQTLPDLREFMRGVIPLDRAQRLAVIDAATTLLGGYYVHLPQKRLAHGIDPIGALGRLRANLPPDDDDVSFQEAICGIFAQLRDLHTQYTLPTPYQNAACLLPFRLEMYADGGTSRYVVTDLQGTFELPPAHKGFSIGAEVLKWGNDDIETAVTKAAALSCGANQAASQARALAAMTIRPMLRRPPPPLLEADITLTYRAADGRSQGVLTLPWHVVDVALETANPKLARFVGIDHEGAARRHVVTRGYHARVLAASRDAGKDDRIKAYPESPALATTYPTIFRAHALAGTDVGYIRIFSFSPPPTDQPMQQVVCDFTMEFVRLLRLLPPNKLVIDVRGNGGGILPLAESLLQTLTPNPITPETGELPATAQALALSRECDDLACFVPSLATAIDSGEACSDRFPITRPEWCNWYGQSYFGSVVLIIDALCYSATDAFAAGFADHAIGKILGVSATTGAGGANAWTLDDFIEVPCDGLTVLPHKASLRVALRRTRRVRANDGDLVEEVGVVPSIIHQVTRDDLLHGDRDLLIHAAQILA